MRRPIASKSERSGTGVEMANLSKVVCHGESDKCRFGNLEASVRSPRRAIDVFRGCANHRSQSHDVSQRNGGVGAWRRREAGKMRSMLRMGPPQSGQTWLASTASLSTGSGDEEAFSGLASSSPSRARHKAIFLAVTIRHESEIADAVEAVGQGMKQKAADELVWLQPHDLFGAVLTVILPGEGDVIVVESFDAAVGDGDAMGVAAEIGENLGGSAERLLGIDHPVDAAHGLDESREGVALDKVRQAVEEPQHSGLESRLQAFEKQPPEQSGEWFDGEKKVRPFGDPSCSIA